MSKIINVTNNDTQKSKDFKFTITSLIFPLLFFLSIGYITLLKLYPNSVILIYNLSKLIGSTIFIILCVFLALVLLIVFWLFKSNLWKAVKDTHQHNRDQINAAERKRLERLRNMDTSTFVKKTTVPNDVKEKSGWGSVYGRNGGGGSAYGTDVFIGKNGKRHYIDKHGGVRENSLNGKIVGQAYKDHFK